jgi:catechol 2,3-dioxygenase-like lactoylglutathione lyase family enzyme
MNTAPSRDEVDHIAILVADIDQSVRWYLSSFSCDLIEQGNTYAVIQFENIKVVLTLPSIDPPHIGLKKVDAHTYGELRQRSDGAVSTYVSDPTGNIVELLKS